eukprot:Opistho-2@22630
MEKADKAVAQCNFRHYLHDEHVVVHCNVDLFENGRHFVLRGGDLVVARLHRHTELPQNQLGLLEEGENAAVDRPEVVVLERLPLGGLGALQRATAGNKIRARHKEMAIDEEKLLLRADICVDSNNVFKAEETKQRNCFPLQCGDGAQEGGLGVERLAAPGAEGGGNAQRLAIRALPDERGRGRIPQCVSARLEGRAEASRGKGASVRLALDQLLSGKLKQQDIAGKFNERVVLFRRLSGEWLEPMAKVRGALFNGPFAHRICDNVSEAIVHRRAALDHGMQSPVRVLRQLGAHHTVVECVDAKHVFGEDMVLCDVLVCLRQVQHAQHSRLTHARVLPG